MLRIKGFHIPSKKNSKLIAHGKLITKPEYQKLLKMMEASIESQLRSCSQTAVGETSTEEQRLSWIASSTPADDCWTKVSQLAISGKLTTPGNEGCLITIERIE